MHFAVICLYSFSRRRMASLKAPYKQRSPSKVLASHFAPANDHRYTPAGRVTSFSSVPECCWMSMTFGWWQVSLWSPTLVSIFTKTKLPFHVHNLKLFSHSKIPFWRSHNSFKLTLVISLSAWLQQCSGKKNLTVQRVWSLIGLSTASKRHFCLAQGKRCLFRLSPARNLERTCISLF